MSLLLLWPAVIPGPPSQPPASYWPVLFHNLFTLALEPWSQLPSSAPIPHSAGSHLVGRLQDGPLLCWQQHLSPHMGMGALGVPLREVIEWPSAVWALSGAPLNVGHGGRTAPSPHAAHTDVGS